MKRSKEYLESQARLQAIIDTAVDGIISIDRRGSIESINRAGASLFGYEDITELLGQNVKMLMPEPYHSQHDGYLQNYHETGEKKIIGIGREVQGLRKDGTTFPFRLSVAEVEVADRVIYTGIIHDISDRVLREEIQKALEKERELNELKSRFVSIASHEFRTPLTSIMTSATLIGKYQDETGQARRLKHISRIQNSVRYLKTILNDFLSLSKLEEGKTTQQPIYFNIKDFCREVIEEMETITKEGQHFHYEHIGEQEQVFLDKKLLHNILINLLSNASKYSSAGQPIYIQVAFHPEHFQLIVKDEGIGISKEAQANLFERFFRADNALNEDGTGLGLHLVKRYVELMDGKISVESDLNKGCKMTLTFNYGTKEDFINRG